MIREVDIQGLISIKEKLAPEILKAIFIAPPDLETLQKRILRRQPQISTEEMERRTTSAKKELAQKNLADYEVVREEGKIEEMVGEGEGIIERE